MTKGWTRVYSEVGMIGSRAYVRMWTLLGAAKQPMTVGSIELPMSSG